MTFASSLTAWLGGAQIVCKMITQSDPKASSNQERHKERDLKPIEPEFATGRSAQR